MKTTINLSLAVGLLLASTADAATQPLARVSHSDVRDACMSDGAALEHYYYDVAAFNWGAVVPLNVWYHPQLMQFHPKSALLEHVAIAAPHNGQGNEDDKRLKIFAHKGKRASDSFVMFTIYGYEDIDDENGKHDRDSAVMSIRTVETKHGSGRLPRRKARVVNMREAEAKNGIAPIPARCGAPYDQKHRIIFAPRLSPEKLPGQELFQMFRFDPADGSFRGRSSFSAPKHFTLRHEISFMDVTPEYGLLTMGAITPWQGKLRRGSLYLMCYEDAPGNDVIAKITAPMCTNDFGLNGCVDDASCVPNPTAACFTDDGMTVYLLLAGGDVEDKSRDEHSSGIYIYKLGPLGGRYQLGLAQGKLALANGVTELEIFKGRVYASSHGMHVYDLKDVLSVTGDNEQGVQPLCVYPLPYDTHGFDFATISGSDYLFLTAGRNGMDTFEIDAEVTATEGTVACVDRTATLNGRPVQILLETGAKVKNMDHPVMSANGHISLRVTSAGNGELIVLKLKDTPGKVVADSAFGEFISFGQPSINNKGQVAFWAARPNGSQALMFYAGATLKEVVETADKYFYLRYPKLAANGNILFGGKLAGGAWACRNSLFLVEPGKIPRRVFTEDADKRWALGVPMPGNYGADYDISTNGMQIAFSNKYPMNGNIFLWQDDTVRPLLPEGQYVITGFVRFSRGGGHVTFRRWSHEVISMNRVDMKGKVVELAQRRAVYGKPSVNPGNFSNSRMDSSNRTVFTVTENTQTGTGKQPLGNQLWLSGVDHLDAPDIIARPLDRMGDKTILNVGFFDGYGNESVALTLDTALEHDGKLSQCLVIVNTVK